MTEAPELVLGMMSGTSVDGIDAALVAFKSSSQLEVIETEFTAFDDQLRKAINAIALDSSTLRRNEDSALHSVLADHYARASLSLIKKSGVTKSQISAIANHGQTVRHEPDSQPPFSLQLGDGQRIANLTGIRTITQFRQADLAAGGQGAPLMPAFHKAVFARSPDTLVVNLGGIANITILDEPVIGFDTGPANCLLDQWISHHKNVRYDQSGDWATSGTCIDEVLALLLDDPYLDKAYPKSTGTDYFNLEWLNARIANLYDYSPADIQATLLAFTIETIALALQQLGTNKGTLFVCGGGARNQALISALEIRLPGFQIQKTDQLGVPSDWVEAVGFAWLGYCYLHCIPSNLPSVTGARRALVLGESFLPQHR